MPRPVVLSHGFRPFFLLAGVWAVAGLALWMGAYHGAFSLASAFPPTAWHRHEMLFGYVAAVIGGFLLTAVPNWTGRPVLSGPPLAGMALLWIAGRVAVAFSGAIGVVPAMLVDGAFLLVLAGWALRAVAAAGNKRNLPVAVVIALLALANLGDHAGLAGWPELGEAAYRLGFSLVVMLIALIGGRIVPAFTRNWLTSARGAETGLPAGFGRLDGAALALTAAALTGWVLEPQNAALGWLFLAAGLVQLARLTRWRGWRTGSEPLVTVLHLAYLWLPVGLLLLAWSLIEPGIPRNAGLHALGAGAMGAMPLAVMTRASLGHTGRELTAGPGTVLVYLLIFAGAIARVAAYFAPEAHTALLGGSAALWMGGFLAFLAVYGPILLTPRRESAASG